MPSPFPGMDPFLEHPDLWPDVHHGLIEGIRDHLAPLLRPRYRVAVEKRTYLAEPEGLEFVGRPDAGSVREPSARGKQSRPPPGRSSSDVQPVTVTLPLVEEIREAYLEVRTVGAGEVVACLEILSPSNKRGGDGRRIYEHKRWRVLASLTHLVEIDLLRSGDPMPLRAGSPPSAYRVLVSRSDERPSAKLYPFGPRDPIPSFVLPLAPGDREPLVDVGSILGSLYDRAGYDLAVEYGADPVPPLEGDDLLWMDRLRREKGLR